MNDVYIYILMHIPTIYTFETTACYFDIIESFSNIAYVHITGSEPESGRLPQQVRIVRQHTIAHRLVECIPGEGDSQASDPNCAQKCIACMPPRWFLAS